MPKKSGETKEDQEELWVEKYRPKNLKEVIAGRNIIEQVVKWAKEWEKGNPQKPLLFAGPPGVGKTSLAHAIAGTFGWEVVELNASDQRNWQIINRIVGESAFNETISDEGEFLSSKAGKLKLIILDEVDNISKKEDAGGEGALIKLLKKKPKQPIILTANDPYNLSLELRNLCIMINFRRIDKRNIVKVLERICNLEGIRANRRALEIIAENAGGDLRAAINDLQAIAEGKKEIREEDVVTGKRTQETDIFKVMQKIFKTRIPVYNEISLLDESPEDVIMWIDENVPLEYSGESLFRAYMILSRADIFLGRVRRRQYYRLWRYATYLMSCGVQSAKDERKKGFTRYRRPSIWQLLFMTKSKREKLRSILRKIGKKNHMSRKKAMEMLPLVKLLLSKDAKTAAKITAFYEFDEEELEFLVGERTKEILESMREVEAEKEKRKSKKETEKVKDKIKVEIETKIDKIETKESDKEESVKSKTKRRRKRKSKTNEEVSSEVSSEVEEKEKEKSKKSRGKNATLDFFI